MKVTLRSIVPVDHLQLIRNGEVVAELPLQGDRTRADTTLAVEIPESSWLVLRAYGDKAIEPVLDIYPFGTTSPIYVSLAGKPVRKSGDAEYFMKWLDRLQSAVTAHEGWNTPSERREVLERVRLAREEFLRRR